MVKLSAFLATIEAMKRENPSYKSGGNGSGGVCDCVGMIMGAMQRNGHKKYDMHSSNYFARYQMVDLADITSSSQLRLGDIVYKTTTSIAKLNARYQAGGRYYTGDLLDYYHVGVVTSVNPLKITHCTSPGIIVDTKLGEWSKAGRLKDIDYDSIIETNEVIGVSEVVIRKAKVYADSGEWVRCRKAPDGDAITLEKINIGTTVTVYEQAGDWAQIGCDALGNKRGYMMVKFLKFDAQDEVGVITPVGDKPLEYRVEDLETRLKDLLGLYTELSVRLSALDGGAVG